MVTDSSLKDTDDSKGLEMTYKVLTMAVCDDDKVFAENFSSRLYRHFSAGGISCKIVLYLEADSLIQTLEAEYYDIIFLDIEIGASCGIDVGNAIRNRQDFKTQIVFISNHPDYHHSGKLYGPVPMAFIQKPGSDEELLNIVRNTALRILPMNKDNYFSFEFQKQIYRVLKQDIIYIESNGKSKIIYTENNKYVLRTSMDQLIKNLDNFDFVLIHRSFLVNANKLTHLSWEKATCCNGAVLPVGRLYRDAALLFITQFWDRQKGRKS